jgi:hypothetical protein
MNIEQEPSRNLTTEECEELAAGLVEDTAALPPGPKKEEMLKLAQDYRNLAEMKRLVAREVN